MNGKIFVEIVRALNRYPKITAIALATKLGVSKRTIYRYIDELTVSGIPINTEFGRNGGIFLDENYRNSKDKIIV